MLPGTLEYKELRNLMDMEVPTMKHINALAGRVIVDLISLDALMSKKDADYDHEACQYKGESCSMENYVRVKFGNKAVDLLEMLT